jgi:selenocysteine lyase/cysteine desulfurase
MDSIPRNALMKPGFTRFNLSYFASDEEVDYILDALDFIANHGWKFLPLVIFHSLF